MGQYDQLENPFKMILDHLNKIETMLDDLNKEVNTLQKTKSQNHNYANNRIEMAMKITGLKKKSIYNLVCRRMIPHSKKGRSLYFDEQELNAWIKGGKRKTIDELYSELR